MTNWDKLMTSTPINRMAHRVSHQPREIEQPMSKSGVLRTIEADAAVYGFHKIRNMTRGFQKTAWEIRCANCQQTFRAYWGPDTSPELMVKNMRVRRWDVGRGERPLCPECSHPRKSAPIPKPMAQELTYQEALPNTAMARAFVECAQKQALRNTPEPIFANPTSKEHDAMLNKITMNVAPKIAHEVFIGLDAYFDPKTRLYKNGYDDGRVAAECGTTEEIVAYLRGETFGDLAEDPRINGLRADVAKMQRDFDLMTTSTKAMLRDLQSRLDQLAAGQRR